MADDTDNSGTLTVPDTTIVGQPMSPARAAFLDGLAWNPAQALRNWGRLSQDEQAYVEAMMRLHYGGDFVQAFDAKVSTDPRPDASIFVTNDPSVTPQWLQSAGYRHMYYNGGADVWVHPTGKEVWLMSDPNAAPAPDASAPPQLPPPPPIDPDVLEAERYAKNFQDRTDALKPRFNQLQNLCQTTGGYPTGLVTAYNTDLDQLRDEVDSVVTDMVPLWQGRKSVMTDNEQDRLQKAIDKIKAVPRQLKNLSTDTGAGQQCSNPDAGAGDDSSDAGASDAGAGGDDD